MNTKDTILKKTANIFAKQGYEGVSMSIVAAKTHIAKSVIYHYFKDKDELLKQMFDSINTELGNKRNKLVKPKSAAERLQQVIDFQFENAADVVTVLKYYASFRKDFKKHEAGGFVPVKAYLHIEEVLEYGIKTKEFQIENLEKESKVIAHAINGFVLEYYPQIPVGEERKELVADITHFILRAISNSLKNTKGGEKI